MKSEQSNAPGPAEESPASAENASADQSHVSLWNIPNLLCAIRLGGSPVLVWLALENRPQVFAVVLVCLLLTDWLDGKLAILWKQQTTFGAQLDSVADAAMYTALLFGALWMKWSILQEELVWLLTAMGSYALNMTVGFAKFRRMPSYHTRSAKTCWLLTSIAAISLFADWSIWPVRLAAAGVTLANLEATAITLVLPAWQADVISIYHAVIGIERRGD